MPIEILVFLTVVFAIGVVLLWRARRGGTGDPESPPSAVGDRPERMISVESAIAPHRNIGRPFRVDSGDRPTESVADID
jgi:hypothetical protein